MIVMDLLKAAWIQRHRFVHGMKRINMRGAQVFGGMMVAGSYAFQIQSYNVVSNQINYTVNMVQTISGKRELFIQLFMIDFAVQFCCISLQFFCILAPYDDSSG